MLLLLLVRRLERSAEQCVSIDPLRPAPKRTSGRTHLGPVGRGRGEIAHVVPAKVRVGTGELAPTGISNLRAAASASTPAAASDDPATFGSGLSRFPNSSSGGSLVPFLFRVHNLSVHDGDD